jgi:hypothetical protein
MLTCLFVLLSLIICMSVDANNRRRAALATILLVVIAAVAGCGSGSTGTDASAGGLPSEFIKHGNEDNRYARYGHEATEQEREEAAKILSENLKAREAANWVRQCASLSVGVASEVEQGERKHGCVASLRSAGEPLKNTASVRKDTFSGTIAVLRVKGNHAYALFHGTDHKDHAIPMLKEDDAWKVASLLIVEAP